MLKQSFFSFVVLLLAVAIRYVSITKYSEMLQVAIGSTAMPFLIIMVSFLLRLQM